MPSIPADVRDKLVALGKRIKSLRERFRHNRASLARAVEERLATTGGCYQTQTPDMIRGIEMGRTFMNVNEVRALAWVLGDDSIGDEYERLKKESGQ